MKVVIAGATGVLGRPLVRRLVEAGHEVVGITRTGAGASALRSAGAEAVVVDVMQGDALLAAFEGQKADAVIHELTDLSKPPTKYADMAGTNALRTEGSAHLIALAQQLGATRFITQSIVFGYGYADRGETVLTEDSPFGVPQAKPTDAAIAAMASAESQAQSVPGITGIALRYGLFYGGDLADYELMLRKHSLPVTFSRGTLALIHHSDAATATVAALERGRAGAYNIVDGRPTTWRELIEGIAEARHAPKPMILPGWLVRLVAPYAGVMMTRVNYTVSNEKAKRELGWVPTYPSYREGLGIAGRA